MKNTINYIKDTSVSNIAKLVFFIFITYAIIDVGWKVSTHSHYDMQRLTKDIQEHFPYSKLTFQNIKVVDNDFKTSHGRGAPTTYQETQYLYIRNNSLREEPNFIYALFLLPIVIVFSVFTIDNPDIKLGDITKMDNSLISFLLTTLLIMLFSLSLFPEDKYQFKRYKNPKAFTFEVENTRKEINIDDYRK